AARRQAVDQGQGKGGSFAGTGLGDAQNITASERYRNSLRLDRSGFGIAGIGNGLKGRGRQAQLGKLGHRVLIGQRITSSTSLADRAAPRGRAGGAHRQSCSELGAVYGKPYATVNYFRMRPDSNCHNIETSVWLFCCVFKE